MLGPNCVKKLVNCYTTSQDLEVNGELGLGEIWVLKGPYLRLGPSTTMVSDGL
jgi:hypothetical protein